MKDKVICPDCGFVQDIAEFLERLEEFDEEATECANCCETIYVTWKEVSYQSYQIDLQASGRAKDFVVRTYNNQDSNKLSVEFKGYNWSGDREFEKEPNKNKFKEAVKELKKEIVGKAEKHYSKELKNIQRMRSELK